MNKITIMPDTCTNPLEQMGIYAGLCWGSPTEEKEKNIKRGRQCLKDGHGRVSEFPQVYIEIDGYSARFMRELYTHIGGAPTRLQASTRYIDYEHGFDYIFPPAIDNNIEAKLVYMNTMKSIQEGLKQLTDLGIKKEDAANLLPLGMTSKMVLRTNLRNLIDMSHQRLCSRAYWEFRDFMKELMSKLSEISPEWEEIISEYFKPKCEIFGYCPEKFSCGRTPRKEET